MDKYIGVVQKKRIRVAPSFTTTNEWCLCLYTVERELINGLLVWKENEIPTNLRKLRSSERSSKFMREARDYCERNNIIYAQSDIYQMPLIEVGQSLTPNSLRRMTKIIKDWIWQFLNEEEKKFLIETAMFGSVGVDEW